MRVKWKAEEILFGKGWGGLLYCTLRETREVCYKSWKVVGLWINDFNCSFFLSLWIKNYSYIKKMIQSQCIRQNRSQGMIACVLKRIRICYSQFCHCGLRMILSWKHGIIHYDFRVIPNCYSNLYTFPVSFYTGLKAHQLVRDGRLAFVCKWLFEEHCYKGQTNFSD